METDGCGCVPVKLYKNKQWDIEHCSVLCCRLDGRGVWEKWIHVLIGKDSDAGSHWGQEEKGTTEDERKNGKFRSLFFFLCLESGLEGYSSKYH